MRIKFRYLLITILIMASLILLYSVIFILLKLEIEYLLSDWTFIAFSISYFFIIEELIRWARIGKRSELSDIVAIIFFFFLIFFFSKDLLTSIMGAFSIYLWLGIYELKDYPVLNKVLIISLVTYNIIFISGIISTYLGDPFLLNSTFAFSFWIILILGFLLFGRKYIIIWRFMSPEYLTLFLYIIAWLAVVFIDQYTPLQFILYEPISSHNFNIFDLFFNIYFILIVVNWFVYFISGPILDIMLGIKRVKDQDLIDLVEDVKRSLHLKGKVKVGFGKYPILNAMAYGSVFDKRIALIAEDYQQIPRDEMVGIVAHELAHTKGKHTLILAFITSIDLLIRMFLGIPATFYDYTFGNPRIPLLGFILLNFGIYIFLYIFVRILEGKADLTAKKAGYAIELTKALYNLESFYATGREIGLNTMLLCDEKINQDNKKMNFIETARYLHNSMIKPSRASLISNIINSHPPTYHRIPALLDNSLKPVKEAFLPFILLSKKKVREYAEMFEKADSEFKKVAKIKFKELFQIASISDYFEELNRKEIYKYDLDQTFIFKNKISSQFIVGKLIEVQLNNEICNPDLFIIEEYKTNKILNLDASLFSRNKISINGAYFLKKNKSTILKGIEFNENKTKVRLLFDTPNLKISNKDFSTKIKLPPSVNSILDFKNQEIFLKEKGKIKVLRCIDVISANSIENFKILLKYVYNDEIYDYSLNQLIIRPKSIYLTISKSKQFKQSEYELIKWLKDSEIRTYISLKKPVNNSEIGYIHDVYMNDDNFKLLKEKNIEYLNLKNIFEKEVKISYQSIDHLSFEYKTALLMPKSEISFITKLGYKLIKKFKPQNIFYS